MRPGRAGPSCGLHSAAAGVPPWRFCRPPSVPPAPPAHFHRRAKCPKPIDSGARSGEASGRRALAGPVHGEEAILVADIDRGEIARGRYDLDVAGHYARPDVFRLLVDEREKPVEAPMPDEE